MEPFRIIQISDIHLFAENEKSLLSVNTEKSFQAVLGLLREQKETVDLILLSGDLAQDGSEAAYLRIAQLLKPFNVPVYCIPGNHDNTQVMAHVYPRDTISSHRHIVLEDWHLILLNSQKHHAVAGYLDSSQLNYLQHCLQTYPEHHAMVILHHPPVVIGSRWLDKLGLQNAEELWQILMHYPKVHTLLFGHVHQEFAKVVNGIQCYAPPSTCIQFKPKQDHFELDFLPPGYRWIYLYADGSLKTGIERVSQYIGFFDKDATGYE